MSTPSTSSANRYVIPFAVVTILFFMWGFITVLVDSLIPRLKMVFELTYFQAGLIQFAFFGAYFLVSIPGGRLISRIGYKRGVVAGLSLMAIGCMLFYPAASVRVYGLFLAALFVLASGMTILQVAANPYVVALGPASSASARLNLSQAFNSLGTTIAPFFGSLLLLGSVVLSAEQQA
ncbi:MAG: MFS transporter, partial [Bacteroidetes bacterium]|nr:MFS transporter [Bacteroidota bacterium]